MIGTFALEDGEETGSRAEEEEEESNKPRRKRPAPESAPAGPEDAAWTRLIEEVATKRALQRQQLALAKLHVRRSANLLRRVEARARELEPRAEELRQLKERLRDDATRAADLARLKRLTRQADTPARLAADLRLERLVALYDSDGDVREAAALPGAHKRALARAAQRGAQ